MTISNVTPLMSSDSEAPTVATPVYSTEIQVDCVTPVHTNLFTIKESKSIQSPFFSEFGKSFSADFSNFSPIHVRSSNIIHDEERGDCSMEVGFLQCYCVPSRVSGLGEFLSRTWTWLRMNKHNVLSSITVTCTFIPEVISNAILAGVQPEFALQGAWMMNCINAVLGGRPGMISGTSTYVSVALIALVQKHGVSYIFYALMLAGILQFLFGLFRLGALCRLIPLTAVQGFSNAMAFIIVLNQVRLVRRLPDNAFKRLGFSWQNLGMHRESWYPSSSIIFFGVEMSVSLSIMALFHLVMRRKNIPSGLIAILICGAIEHGILRTLTKYSAPLVSSIANIKSPYVRPIWKLQNVISLPPFNFDTLEKIYLTSLAIFGSNLMENSLVQRILDEKTNTQWNINRSFFSNGIAETITAALGGIGGSGSVGQSLVLFQAHGVSRLSTFLTGLLVMISIYFAYEAINLIPLGAIAGIMVWTGLCLVDWMSLLGIILALLPRSWRERVMPQHIDRKVPRSDSIVVVAVLGISICYDLSIAVIVGVLLSVIAFVWDNSNRIYIESERFDGFSHGKVIYYSEGPLFFGSAQKFISMFPYNSYEKEVIIDLERTEIYDQSGMAALKSVYDNFVRQGKITAIASLNDKSRRVMEKMAYMWEGVNFLLIDDTGPDEKYSTTSDILLH